ncbi:MAG TPA: hypothetical protein VIK91_10310, partial [Nannocystis sp.]
MSPTQIRAARALTMILPLLAGASAGASGCEPYQVYTSGTETSTTGTSTGGTTGESEVPEVCLRYVACLKEVDAAAGAEAEKAYGAGGSCWADEATAGSCLSFCDAQLRNYAMAFPDVAACESEGVVSDVEFEIGAAIFDPMDPFLPPTYQRLEDGDTIAIVRGGQGLL